LWPRRWLRRRLFNRRPSADWTSCSWGFDDLTDGATVVEAALGPPGAQGVVAVAVRDEAQPQKPVKVQGAGFSTRVLSSGGLAEPPKCILQ
jgi:hypothetical protein